jgi:hypothetical protein
VSLRAARVELAPLLDVVFIVLLFYMGQVVEQGQEDSQRLTDKRLELEDQHEDLRDRYTLDRAVFMKLRAQLAEELKDRLVIEAERDALRDELAAVREELAEARRDMAHAEESTRSDMNLFREMLRRDDRPAETAALLQLVEHNYNVYEITIYHDNRLAIQTPKNEEIVLRAPSGDVVVDMIEDQLPATFDSKTSLFLMRVPPNAAWFLMQFDFLQKAKTRDWIFAEVPWNPADDEAVDDDE